MTNKKLNYPAIAKEMAILTGASDRPRFLP